ncbi:hypothetical protein WJX75_002162 [Coccomyxa subellipsoidea]|uniref:HECT domain-containing protein n=1 Tax=Coccomyxa subellipsoidea TaxID=248742 RepID=A0ABR2Z2Q2_9CHLO
MHTDSLYVHHPAGLSEEEMALEENNARAVSPVTINDSEDELAVDAADAGGGFVVAVFDREGWYSAEFGAALDTCGNEALTLYANLGTGLRGEEEVCRIDLPLYHRPEIAVTRGNEFSSLHVELQSSPLSKYRAARFSFNGDDAVGAGHGPGLNVIDNGWILVAEHTGSTALLASPYESYGGGSSEAYMFPPKAASISRLAKTRSVGALAHLLLHGVSVPTQLSSVVKKAMTAPGISFPAIGWLLGDEDLEEKDPDLMDQLRLLRTAELPWTEAVHAAASVHAENVKDELELNLQLPEDLESVIQGRIWISVVLPVAAELNALREGFQGVAGGYDALQMACDIGVAMRALGLAFVKNQPLTSADFAVEGVDRWLRVWGELWLSRTTAEQLERLAKFVFGVRLPLPGNRNSLLMVENSSQGDDHFPRSRTCFGELVVPKYSNYEHFAAQLARVLQSPDAAAYTYA